MTGGGGGGGGFSTTTIFLICRHQVTDYFTFLLIILCHTCQFGCVIGRTFALKTKKDIKIQRKIFLHNDHG